jgi:hypothetical protein
MARAARKPPARGKRKASPAPAQKQPDAETQTKSRGGRPSSYDPKYCDELIEHCTGGLSFESFAGAIGVCFKTLYNWADKHPEFLQAQKIGEAKAMLFWEKANRQCAVKGVGNVTANIFALKNRGIVAWKDRVVNEHVGKNDGPIETRAHPVIDPTKLTTEELEAFDALLSKAKPDARGSQGGASAAV